MKKTSVLYKIIIWLLVITIFNGSLNFAGINKSYVVKAMTFPAILQQMIDDTPYGGTLYLDDDEYQSPTCSPSRIVIDKPISIIGVPNTYGGYPTIKSLVFAIDADDVSLENLNFTKHSVYEEEKFNEDRLFRLLIVSEFVGNFTATNCTFSGTTDEYPPIPAVYFGSGGLVYVNSNTSSAFINCTFKDSIATGSGGAVCINDVYKATFTECVFDNNSVSEQIYHWAYGGAMSIYNSEEVIINDCTFTNNYADYYGGAMYSYSSDVTINDSAFLNNNCVLEGVDFDAAQATSFGLGGAIHAMGASSGNFLDINNCIIEGNQAYNGGGVFCREMNLDVQNTSFINNSAIVSKDYSEFPIEFLVELFVYIIFFPLDPSALIKFLFEYAMDAALNPSINLTNGKGKIGGMAGALEATSAYKTNIYNTRFEGNTAETSGGAIVLAPYLFRDAAIDNCYFESNFSQLNGGAVLVMTRTIDITSTDFVSNQSEVGGAIYSIADINVTDSAFLNNSSEIGGAIAGNTINNDQVYTRCTFEDNFAKSGGAVYMFSSEEDEEKNTVAVADCIFKMIDCEIMNNSSQYEGGAIALSRVTTTIDNNNIFDNSTDESGGAIYSSNNADLTIKDTLLENNSSLMGGGAIYNYDAYLTLFRSEIINNRTTVQGGGIYDNAGKKVVFKNTLFAENSSASASAIYLKETNIANMINCTVANNSAVPIVASNMGIFTFKLRNNIIVANSAPTGVSINDIYDNSAAVDAEYNLCARPGVGNITGTADVFVDMTNGNYHLAEGYTFEDMGVIDAGTTDDANPLNLDLDRNPRQVDNDGDGNNQVDMGAYEHQQLLVEFYDKHPNSAIAYGTINGETTQYIPFKNTLDLAAVIVTCTAGMQFDGWYTYEGIKVDDTTKITASTKLYATYSEIMCEVTYEYNPQQVKIVSSGEGINASIDATTRQFITQVPMYYSPEYPIMKGINGYEFAGWDKMPSWITEDTLIKATYRPTATYDFGTKGFYYEFIIGIPPIVILETVYITSQLAPLESPPPANIYAYDGYAFLGWSDIQDGTVITLPASVNGSTTYYAVYDDLTPPDTADKFTLDIEFDNPAEPGGSLDWISKQFDSGTVVDLTTNTAIPDIGYEFIGFKDEGGNYITTITMDSAHTITVEFKKIQCQLTVHISGNGSINPGLEGIYDFNETIQLSNTYASANTGSTFAGFKDDADHYITTITLLMDTAITAVFNPNDYTVDFTTNGNGIIVGSINKNYIYGDIIDLSAITLSANEGYAFSHWVDSANNIFGNSYTVTESETLMAVFNIIQYTLTVNVTGSGSVTNIAGDYDIGTEVALLYEYAHPSGGDEFLGYTDENGTFTTSITMNADRTITAVFGTPTYNVLFNSNGGSEVSPYLGVASESLIAEPSEPTNGDLVFSGWFSDSGILWDFANDTVVDNVILHAKWREEQILTYDANGSSGSFSEIQYTNEWFNLNDGVGFVRDGYALDGWNSLSNGPGLSYTLGQQYMMPAHHVTMYADWSPNTYSLYYDANFGTGSATETHKTDEIFILLTGAGIKREGYVITAWEIEGNVYPLYAIFTMLPHDTTANAIWTLDSDKDGISDIDELLVGTDTLNKFNYPYIGNISGIVLDIDGNPVAGNTLVLNSVAQHMVSDADGQFLFNNIYLAPHTLTLRNGYTNLGIYDLKFINGSHNNAVILDSGSTDSVGSTRVHVNYLFDTLYIVIQYNDINQWEIEGLSFTEGKDAIINPPTGQATTKWYKQLLDKLLELLKFFIIG